MENKDVKILIVDDEPDILEILEYNLLKEGYQIFKATNGQEAIDQAKKITPHLILLDIMMPDLDGIETCRELRNLPQLEDSLVAFLTARNEDYSQIAGFDVGADDYIKKPIKPRVLVSRVKGLLRRYANSNENTHIMQVCDLKINLEKYLVYKEDEQVILPRKEFEILKLLATKPGKVFSRDEILNMVWDNDIIVGDRTIDVHVRKLREKVGDHYIKTVKGVGYKLDQ
ncbi:MAG: DNA-binding response regulator [Bacteroidetes bacterium SW_10_40_5]|nr:MAG: DNA-binding response regulator [Bacteroidetes bacterium SW_10_40_5]